MNKKSGLLASIGAVLSEGGPWGSKGNKGAGDGGSGDGGRPPNPWSRPPEGDRPRGGRTGPSAADQVSAKLRDIFGGGGGGGHMGNNFSRPDGKKIWPYAVLAVGTLWIAFTSFHRIGPEQAGVITRFGKYAGTLAPGIGMTLPAPIDRVQKLDIQAIRTIDIGSTAANRDNLVLTGDQNIVDLAYSVRWNIKAGGAEQFLFQIAEPETTISEVAESAMRFVVANYKLNEAIGSGRADIEQQVASTMQRILDSYKSGVQIQGVAIRQADPPAAVNDAFKEVSAAQQQVETNLNAARAYAQQITANAEGEANAFDQVYVQYRLSPEVTRRRMYYETMERILAKVDKTIVEAPGVTPYLPLPEIKKRAQAAPAPAQAQEAGQ